MDRSNLPPALLARKGGVQGRALREVGVEAGLKLDLTEKTVQMVRGDRNSSSATVVPSGTESPTRWR